VNACSRSHVSCDSRRKDNDRLALVDFTKEDHARVLGLRIVRNGWVEEEDAYRVYCQTYRNITRHHGGWCSVRMSPPCWVGTSLKDSLMSILLVAVSLQWRILFFPESDRDERRTAMV
jgi:hypothetical protein